MNKQNNMILTALFTMIITAGTVANVAQAAESKDNKVKELQLFSKARISLSEAIKAAELKTGGKAIEAELDDESKTVQFEIEIVKEGKIHEVIVDGETGHVLKVSLDDESKDGVEHEKE